MLQNPLTDLIQTPLPSKNFQRKRRYRPTRDEIHDTYDLINRYVFDSKLVRPSINLRTMNVWGLCTGYEDPVHRAKIKLSNDFFCLQWMVLILAHEMAHQYQWEVHGPRRVKEKRVALLSHGPSFYEFKPKMSENGIPLRIVYSTEKWFKYQDLSKV